jgi:hypothetical protein
MTDAPISLGDAPPETVMPFPPEEWMAELDVALRAAPDARRAAVAEVAAAHPRFLDAWAELASLARDDTEAYAYARVGYHRGLDALRGAGWHGTGYVRWQHESNRGFLRALDALGRAAGAIGEDDEEDRCAIFLRQLDPNWDRVSDL